MTIEVRHRPERDEERLSLTIREVENGWAVDACVEGPKANRFLGEWVFGTEDELLEHLRKYPLKRRALTIAEFRDSVETSCPRCGQAGALPARVKVPCAKCGRETAE